MKRSQLKRRKPLRRSRSIRKRIPRRVRRMSEEDMAYRAFVHTLTCAGYGKRDWNGRIHLCGFGFDQLLEQSHERDHTGLGLKAPERRSVMMCRSLHRRYEAEHVRAKEWMDARIAEANAKFDSEHREVMT